MAVSAVLRTATTNQIMDVDSIVLPETQSISPACAAWPSYVPSLLPLQTALFRHTFSKAFEARRLPPRPCNRSLDEKFAVPLCYSLALYI
ncbi:hypothetical protein BOTNAR_0170g00030 [Botryotinia narcissicola]|uniref:Uncharacterized protein n=1 Tax=Botryotinia narcissicola TaxID=278944 RepID=A0A4Z1IQP2_9HELO|nr:hypothetical protein BOTNAR_0170g00030 [Botryotinia narcissicola]